MSQTIQECPDPWPEELVTSVAQIGLVLIRQEYLLFRGLVV